MDQAKMQSGADDKEAHALEGTDTVVEKGNDSGAAGANSGVTDATQGNTSSSGQSNKPPIIKRLWQKFNIYLLLFLLVILVFAGVTIMFYLKNKNDTDNAKETIDSQSLSEEAAKQLSSSSVTVGSSKQILNVASNAIFGGSVLVRSDLEVAGDIKVGGNIELPNLSVTGATEFDQLQTKTLSVTADATVQGTLTVRRGVSILGTSTFGNISAAQVSTNALQLNGNLVLTKHLVAGGPIPGSSKGTALGSGGTVSVNGSDTAGSITVNTGSGPGAGCFINITFVNRYDNVPHVIVTPVGSGAAGLNYYINRSTTGFSVCTTNSAPSGQTFGFDYMIVG
jgi:cytoskeletal protein CcmA (bactofilin family)